jgi:hypothetical protein
MMPGSRKPDRAETVSLCRSANYAMKAPRFRSIRIA